MSEQGHQFAYPNPDRYGRVAVLYGGQAAEREISLTGGTAVLEGLRELDIDAVGLDVDADWIMQIQRIKPDLAFILLHGRGGEDGVVQGALESLSVPYTGSGVLASALAMDKTRCKQFWSGINLRTPAFQVLEQNSDWQMILDSLGGKVMVKPACEGSSLGMSLAESAVELEAAWRLACQFDSNVLAEQWLDGAEYTVAIVNGRVLPTIKLETDRAFYDFQAKYVADDTRYLCPCGLSTGQEKVIRELAMKAYTSLGCVGWGRVDLMVDADGEFSLLEVNTVPGMTGHSLVPMAASADGLAFNDLLVEILAASVATEARCD
jgi:D-alanine-D-alanine ligase